MVSGRSHAPRVRKKGKFMDQKRIISYGLGENIIERIAELIEGQSIGRERDLSRVAIIFGGKRPSLFLKRELSKRLKGSFYSPRFFTIDMFIDYILSRQMCFTKLAEMDACYMLFKLAQQIALSITNEQRFSYFMPWAREIMFFIDQLDMEDVNDDAIKFVQEHAAIGYDIPESINTLLNHIIAIREAYHANMRERSSYSRGFRYREAARIINEYDCNEFDTMFFCDLFFMQTTERTIVKSLYDRGKAYLAFQGSQKEWPVLKDLAQWFECSIEPAEGKSREPAISLYAGFDVHSQIGIVHDVLKKLPNHDNTVVVLPNPDNVIPLLSEISAEIGECNISMGYPLKRSSLYSLFELIFKAQETKKEDTYYARDYLNVLRHPVMKNLLVLKGAAATRVVVHKVEEVLLGIEKNALGGSLFITLKAIEECDDVYATIRRTLEHMNIDVVERDDIYRIIRALHELSFTAWEEVSSFDDFARVCDAFLDTLVRISSLKHYPLNMSIVKRIFTILSEFKTADYREEIFEKEDIFKIFEQYVGGRKISFQGTPLKGLQILGRLETRSLNFQNVIIMDLNEGIYPHVEVNTRLIPREIMIALGLRIYEREEEIQRYHFRRLLKAAQKVFLVYDNAPEKEKSRFVEELLWHKQKRERSLDVMPLEKGYYNVHVARTECAVKKQAYIVDFLKNDFTFSVSSINTYIDCPLKFYYQYVLRLKEKEDFLEEPEGADIGTFVHELLEDTFKQFIGTQPKINKTFRNSFFKRFERKFNDEFTKKMKSDSFTVKSVMKHRLEQFLAYESERDVREILAVEKKYKERVNLGKHIIQFTAKVDRIDKLADNSILVIDYKTGGNVHTPVAVAKLREQHAATREQIKRRIRSFQLPLYLYLIRKEIGDATLDAAFYQLTNCELIHFSKRVEGYPFKESLRLCLSALNTVIEEIFNPAIPFVADVERTGHCSYCPFMGMCG